MSKELEALNDIRKVLEEAYKFPLNLTPQYKFIYEALKRNKPMKLKTKRVKVSIDDYRTDDYCPTCDEELYTTSNYCPHCGQKLDWEEL